MSYYISQEQQADWATDLLDSVGDIVTSQSSVINWLRSNLGELNSRLSTQFIISGSGNISPELNDIQSGIYNELYICYWLRKKARTTLGSMDFDWVEMQGESQGSVKKVSATQKAAAYQSMAKDCDEHMKDLIRTYRGGNFARPRQITFNNRHSTPRDIGCECFNWSPYNPICNYL